MKVRAAVVQAGSVVFDRAATLEKLERLAREAARGGAQLIVFPEAFVSGYPMGLNFGAVVGNRTAEGREQFRLYYESALDVPGPDTERLEALAGELNVHLVIGVVERDGGTLYCSVVYIGPGRYIGKHRKLMPTAAERLVWGFGDGSTLDVYDTDVGRIGAVICWENYMPMLRMTMYSKGIQIYCSPTADSRETWVPTVRHIALEGRCFVLSTCQVLRGADFPPEFPNRLGDTPDTILMRGGACIVSPLGKLLAGPVWDEETILCADLDLDEIPRAKYDFDVVGHYARPDIFRLTVDETQRRPVTRTES
jgi:nitrilase